MALIKCKAASKADGSVSVKTEVEQILRGDKLVFEDADKVLLDVASEAVAIVVSAKGLQILATKVSVKEGTAAAVDKTVFSFDPTGGDDEPTDPGNVN